MQFLLIIATLGPLATFTMAEQGECRGGWRYCGNTLYNMGTSLDYAIRLFLFFCQCRSRLLFVPPLPLVLITVYLDWSQNDISDALTSGGGSIPSFLSPQQYTRSLFECNGGFLGLNTKLTFVKLCNDNEDDQCVNAGTNRDDYCKVAGWELV
jgi:hypothetical protein